MKIRRRHIAVLLGLIVLSLGGLFGILYIEGGSFVGVRNLLDRDGEVRVKLLNGSVVESFTFGRNSDDLVEIPTARSNEVVVKAGYGVFDSKVVYINSVGEKKEVEFKTDKFNNWHRVLYVENEDGSFSRFDNGVERSVEYEGP